METWAGTLKHRDITENEVKDEPLAFTWSPDDRLWEPTVHDTLGCFSRHAPSALIERFLINVWGNKKNILPLWLQLQPHRAHWYSVCSLWYISVEFISLPGLGGDAGRTCDRGEHGEHPILAAVVDSRHVSDTLEEEGREFKWGAPSLVRPLPPSDNFPSITAHCATQVRVASDVDVSDVCWGAGQVRVLVNSFRFRCAIVLLCLSQARLQQRLYLLLTWPQAVLQAQNWDWVETNRTANIK